jgi:hypothetical protein
VSPAWKELEIKSEDAANNNLAQPFRFEVWDRNGNVQLGFIEMTFSEYVSARVLNISIC